MPLRSFRPDQQQTTLALMQAGKENRFVFGGDFLTRGDAARKETSVEAGIAYVGYGVTAPEQDYDDYKGIDAKGKIVAMLFGAPQKFPTTLRAHHSSQREKAANAVAHGAVGLIIVDSPLLEQIYGFKGSCTISPFLVSAGWVRKESPMTILRSYARACS